MVTVLIIIMALGFSMAGFAIFLLYRKLNSPVEKTDESHYTILNQRIDSMATSTNQAIRDTVQLVNQGLRETVQLVNTQLQESRQSVERSSQAINQQVHGFASGLTQLTENLKQVHDSVKNVSSFQNIFKAPKLRGIWGESSLEASLAQYFPRDRYTIQHYFKSGEAVDVVLKLPNDLLLPIDSKFNWENFEKMINADNDIQKDISKKTFFSDVKKKIDEVANKYILPSEGTTDFALMYVPAETVYYEIVSNIKDVDLPAYALSKKIFLVSPNTFMLSVSAISHWLKDIQLSKQTKDIMHRLSRISVDGRKLGDDFRKLGKHISDASGSYSDSEKRLGLMIDRVENIVEIGEKEIKKELEPTAVI